MRDPDHVQAEADYVMRTYGHLLPGNETYGPPPRKFHQPEPLAPKPPGERKPRHDLTGKRFGMLVALSPIVPEKNQGWRWHCRCDCGGESTPHAFSLIQNKAKSCGCQCNHRFGRKPKTSDD